MAAKLSLATILLRNDTWPLTRVEWCRVDRIQSTLESSRSSKRGGAGAAPLGAICRGTGCACRRLRPRRSTSLICHHVLRDVPLGKRADLQATIAQIERVWMCQDGPKKKTERLSRRYYISSSSSSCRRRFEFFFTERRDGL